METGPSHIEAEPHNVDPEEVTMERKTEELSLDKDDMNVDESDSKPIDSGAAPQQELNEDVEMSTPSIVPTSDAAAPPGPAAVDAAAQPPAGAMPAGMPSGLAGMAGMMAGGMPPGMPPMDPFAMLIQMSDRLIDESYKPSSKDSQAEIEKAQLANAQKRQRTGSETGAEGGVEPQNKVQKTITEKSQAAASYSKQKRRYDILCTPVHMHNGLICITFCLYVWNWIEIHTRQKVTRQKKSYLSSRLTSGHQNMKFYHKEYPYEF